ncbi:MAG: hypothetical protein CM15mP106_3350 [Candidatus Neomarinimicrobiota bacterium]|nr:MAG: hypothetical protein CM15mP106_3350 [Candidatus Neomarinimicrobiota bacterium]
MWGFLKGKIFNKYPTGGSLALTFLVFKLGLYFQVSLSGSYSGESSNGLFFP